MLPGLKSEDELLGRLGGKRSREGSEKRGTAPIGWDEPFGSVPVSLSETLWPHRVLTFSHFPSLVETFSPTAFPGQGTMARARLWGNWIACIALLLFFLKCWEWYMYKSVDLVYVETSWLESACHPNPIIMCFSINPFPISNMFNLWLSLEIMVSRASLGELMNPKSGVLWVLVNFPH